MALYVRESGPATAPTIVMLPGGSTGGWFWQPQIDRLPDYHLLVPDLPEQGRSIDEKPFTIADAADRVGDLIRSRAHGGHAHVAGLSLGAQTLVQLLATQPELVDHALVSSANLRGLPGSWLLGPYFRVAMPLRTAPFLIWASMKSAGIPEQYYPDMQREAREMTLDSLTHVTMASLNFRLPEGLERVRCPVLILAAEREPKQMVPCARELVAAIPEAEGRLVRGGIHTWNMQFPDLFAETLRAWIEGRPLPPQLAPLG